MCQNNLIQTSNITLKSKIDSWNTQNYEILTIKYIMLNKYVHIVMYVTYIN